MSILPPHPIQVCPDVRRRGPGSSIARSMPKPSRSGMRMSRTTMSRRRRCEHRGSSGVSRHGWVIGMLHPLATREGYLRQTAGRGRRRRGGVHSGKAVGGIRSGPRGGHGCRQGVFGQEGTACDETTDRAHRVLAVVTVPGVRRAHAAQVAVLPGVWACATLASAAPENPARRHRFRRGGAGRGRHRRGVASGGFPRRDGAWRCRRAAGGKASPGSSAVVWRLDVDRPARRGYARLAGAGLACLQVGATRPARAGRGG
jgi:hypothetical protein